MNLFVFDTDPAAAAAGLDDKRIGKAIMECNQMMSVAVLRHAQRPVDVGLGALCRPTHQGHPVTLWVGATRSNFAWTLAYTWALIEEWQKRFNSWHGSGDRTGYIALMEDCLPPGDLLPFQNSARHGGLGLDFSHLPVTEAYREYIQERWKTDKRPPTFTNTEWPSWVRSKQ